MTKAQEIWETTTGGTLFINVRDPRNPEGWTQRSVGGNGTRRITLSVEEREFNQELVPYENKRHDPFINGLLIRLAPKESDRGEHEFTDEQLVELLTIDSDEVFADVLKGISSEVVVRRLLNLAKKHASMARYEVISNLVDDRYRIGKTSRVVREINNDDARYADTDL